MPIGYVTTSSTVLGCCVLAVWRMHRKASRLEAPQKSGAFRRRCSRTETIVCQSLVDRLSLSAEIESTASQKPPVGQLPNDGCPDTDVECYQTYEDKDSMGLPSCFAIALRKHDGAAAASKASAAIAPVARSSVLYDDDGFSVLDDAASMKSGKEIAAEPNDFPAPINLIVKGRKAAALAATPKKAAKTSETSSSNKVANTDVKPFRPKLRISSHTNVRVELCAVDSEGKRVFIFGSTLFSHGETFIEDSQALKQFISKHEGISKQEALQFRDKLRSKPKST